ncbi:MAG: phosphoglycerol geranylgeranyltransferase [Methanomicrobiales archaeon]|nr:phosphoglycerol geranylgeranyltransferase [Methanomicrobiales archaeon]
MQQKWKHWVHVTKLDPDRTLPPGTLEAVATSGTDALMLSGTLNVTKENLRSLLREVLPYDLPVVVEPASPDSVVTEGVAHLFVPSVINSPDVQWVVGKHTQWALRYPIPWDLVVPEAYIVLNPHSAVGKVTRAISGLSAAEVSAHVVCADRYFCFPIVYIEYSGMYGDPMIVRAASEATKDAVLYYGGGIDSAERAAEMARYADTIVVGNAVYEKGIDRFLDTVRAVQ